MSVKFDITYKVNKHEHIFESEKYFQQCHASTIEILSCGTAVAAWFGGDSEKAPNCGIWVARRLDNQWTEPKRITNDDGIPRWNPVLFDNDGTLTLYYKVGKEISTWQTMVCKSVDKGETWSDAVELIPWDIGGRGPVRNKCIKLQNGTILAPSSIEKGDWDCFVDISEDDGKSWNNSELVPFNHENAIDDGIIQPTLWQDDKGVVHMYTRSSESCIMKSESHDNGKTWAEALPTPLPNNNSGIDLVKLADGRLVLVYNPIAGNWAARSNIAFSLSEDNGKTWSTPQTLDCVLSEVHKESAEFSYPAIVARGNKVFITYTWKRRTIAYWEIEFKPLEKNSDDNITDGVWVTMITPFTADNKVDYVALENLIEWYIEKGVDGLFATCQSSEIFYLNAQEREEMAKFVVDKAAGRVQVIASGHVSDDIDDQIAELKRTAKSGARAVVLISNRLAKEDEDDEVFKANVLKILNAIPNVKFGVYECPYPYKRLISPQTLKWCADTGRFLFLKDACCDIDEIKEKLKAIEGSSLKLFNANSATLLDSLRAGASGFCGVMANFHPDFYVAMVNNYKGNKQLADIIQSYVSMASLIENQGRPIAMYPINAKYHLNLSGVKMDLHTRCKDALAFGKLQKVETKALFDSQRSLRDLIEAFTD